MRLNLKAGSFGFFPIATAVTVTGLFLTAQPCFAQTSEVVPIYTVGTYGGGAWTSNIGVTGFGLAQGIADESVGQTFSINNVTTALIDSIQVPIYGSSSAEFQIGVAAWNGSQPTGSMLYLSSPIAGVNGWQTFTVTPGNLVLNQNQPYALIVTPNAFVGGPSYNTEMGYTPGYSGGEMYNIAGYELSVNDLFNNSWGNANADFAFSMSYQAVPEPSAMALAGLGTLALWLRYRPSIKAVKI